MSHSTLTIGDKENADITLYGSMAMVLIIGVLNHLLNFLTLILTGGYMW